MMRSLGFLRSPVVVLCGLAFLALATPVSALVPSTMYSNSRALLIGIKQYPKLPQGVWLSYAVRNAWVTQKLLVGSYGFRKENVKVLSDADAIRAKIEDALSELGETDIVKKDDRVLIYFSGHGQAVKTASGGEMGLLLPYNASVKLSDIDNAGPFMKTRLPMSRVWDYVQPRSARHVLIIADVCYSGMLARALATGLVLMYKVSQ